MAMRPRRTWRDQRISQVRESRNVTLLINNINRQPIPRLHQNIKILPTRMNSHPSRVVSWCRGLKRIDQCQLPGLCILFVSPNLVRSEIRRVQISLGGIEYHPVNACFGLILVVLDILVQGTV